MNYGRRFIETPFVGLRDDVTIGSLSQREIIHESRQRVAISSRKGVDARTPQQTETMIRSIVKFNTSGPRQRTYSTERKSTMRKIIASAIGAAALVAVPLSLTSTPALADPIANQACSQGNDLGLSHGSCVSLVNNAENGNTDNGAIFVTMCKLLQQQSRAVFDGALKNLGACVSTLLHPPTPTPSPSVSPSPPPSG
jgi:phosphoribosylcarboxyaminoimidazole (NCAIR) mutase